MENSFIKGHIANEVGRLCSLMTQGNPNVVWPFYMAKTLFETPEWHALADWKTEFVTSKAMHQSIGFVENLIKAVERSVKPQEFQYDKAFPILYLMNEATGLINPAGTVELSLY